MQSASSNHDHSYWQDLLGAYVLGSVSPHERREVEAHLATCEACRAEAAELRAVVLALPLSVEEREPSPALYERIQASVRQEIDANPRPEGDREPWRPTPGFNQRPRRLQPAWFQAAAPWAAVLLLFISLGMFVWNLQLRQSIHQQPQAVSISLEPTSVASGAGGQLTYLKDRQVMILQLQGLPKLQPGQVYQVWLIRGSTPVSAGVFNGSDTRYAIAASISEYQALAITNEPGPLGSTAPTGEKFIVTPLPTA